eukprot:1144451-Amphidinium_carterae.1
MGVELARASGIFLIHRQRIGFPNLDWHRRVVGQQSINQSINQSSKQAINQSINQLVIADCRNLCVNLGCRS